MSKFKSAITLITILIVGLFLRLYHNTDISLWHDEAFSALLIKYSWSEMMFRIGLDVHPPMYYIFLRIWHYVLGDSLLALRGFSVFFGLGTALAAYAFVKTAFKNNMAAILTMALVAMSPFQIQYATEARMYTFGAFFSVLAAYFLVKALDSQRLRYTGMSLGNYTGLSYTQTVRRNYICYYILFSAATAIIILTHYYLLFTAASLCVYALLYHLYYYRFHLSHYLWLAASYILIALSFVPWLKAFLFQYKQVGAGYWIPPMDIWSIPATIWQMLLGIGIDVNKQTTQIGLAIVTALTLFIIFRFLRKTESPHRWLTLFTFLAPFGGAILFLLLAKLKGQNSSVYLIRYFLYASTFYTIIIAVWLTQIKYRKVAYFLITAYIATNIAAFVNYWEDLEIASKPGMNKAAALLEANMAPKDKLYVGSSFEFFNLKYYINRMSREAGNDVPSPLLYSGGNRSVKNLPHYAGTAILTDEDLLPDFAEATKPGDVVWLLWTNGFGGTKPNVPANWKQVDEFGYAEVRPYVGTWVIVTQYSVK